MRLRPKMVRWYDPPRLVRISIRIAISTVFGEFADRREALATSRAIDPTEIDRVYDYSRDDPHEDFWLDFTADTGDGWNSTYAIARLLAEPALDVGVSEPLSRGRILVMGGDEVYPVASREGYRDRIIAPFNEAAKGKFDRNNSPHLYAIPGNHDWYDGLLAFLGLFCRRRNADAWTAARLGRGFGGRATQQTRSYFAIKLPHGWWLWGADIQLSGYIDQPQIDFFSYVAKEWMAPGSRLILCTGQPNWSYADADDPEPQFKNFSYLESLADLAGRDHRLCVVLTGDSHHYARFVEGDCSYITSGGGGAFLHPTHQLKDKLFEWPHPPPGVPKTADQTHMRQFRLACDRVTEQPAVFPDQRTSARLAYRNLAFAVLNWQYTAVVGVTYAFFAWILHAQAVYTGSSLMAILSPQPLPPFFETAYEYWSLSLISPWPTILVLISIGGYYYLTDFPSYWRLVVGVLHGIVQAAIVMMATCLLSRWLADISDAWFIVLIGLVGDLLSATALGIYFLLSLNIFGKHWDEAFSSLRIQDHKNFLRLRMQRDGALRIYPIGLRARREINAPCQPKLCRSMAWSLGVGGSLISRQALRQVPREPRRGRLRNPPLHPHLIEQPIDIH